MSKKQIRRLLASRANGAKSRGPVTPEGKQRSALNAITHGLSAQTLLLPGESGDRFQELLQGFEDDYLPTSTTDRYHVEQLAAAAWRIRRAQVYEAQLVRAALEQQTAAPSPARAVTLAWVDSQADRATRYETTHQRNFRRHLTDLRTSPLRGGDLAGMPSTVSNQEVIAINQEIQNEPSAQIDPPSGGSR